VTNNLTDSNTRYRRIKKPDKALRRVNRPVVRPRGPDLSVVVPRARPQAQKARARRRPPATERPWVPQRPARACCTSSPPLAPTRFRSSSRLRRARWQPRSASSGSGPSGSA